MLLPQLSARLAPVCHPQLQRHRAHVRALRLLAGRVQERWSSTRQSPAHEAGGFNPESIARPRSCTCRGSSPGSHEISLKYGMARRDRSLGLIRDTFVGKLATNALYRTCATNNGQEISTDGDHPGPLSGDRAGYIPANKVAKYNERE